MPTISIAPRDVARELARRYSTMTHDELDLLESILVAKKFAKNEKILAEGEICENIYWIVKGLVRQFYYKNCKELTEYMATENTICMCIESLFLEQPTNLQIMAIEPTVLYCLPKARLEAVAMKSVNIQILYRKILEESLILSQIHADMLRFESAIDRYQGPVLIVHGTGDETVPVEYAVRAAERYRRGELVLIPGDTHCYDFHLEQVMDAVRGWLLRRAAR